MDSYWFDVFVGTLARTSTRRGWLGFLAVLSLLAASTGRCDLAEARRHHGAGHRKQRHRPARAESRKKKKKKKPKKPKKTCTPEPLSQTCSGKCGSQTNNCGAPIECGTCGCVSQPVTQTCAGQCGTVRDNCNAPVECGQCVCNPTCQICQVCTSAGTCVTDPTMADKSCGNCHLCAAGQCVSCPHCCDGGTCQAGTSNAACGRNGLPCATCNPPFQCLNQECVCVPLQACPAGKNCGDFSNGCGGTIHCGDCVAPETCEGAGIANVCGCPGSCAATCSSHAECPSNHLCVDGGCHACDATCPTGRCTGQIPQAITAVAPRNTVYVCPGRYGRVNPSRDITIIGAGAAETILDGNAVSPVVAVEAGRTVTLKELRIEGAAGDQDNGLPGGVVNAGSLTMTNCVVTGNSASSTGGGIRNENQLTMTGCTISNNSTDDVSFGGGGIYNVGVSLAMHNCIVEGNTSDADGGGILVEAGNVTLDGDCRVRHNLATSDGGGIYRNLGTVTIEGPSPGNVVAENCPNNCGSPSNIAGCSGGASACP